METSSNKVKRNRQAERKRQASRTYNVQSLGTTIIIDRNGQVVYRDESTSSFKMLEPAVLAALN